MKRRPMDGSRYSTLTGGLLAEHGALRDSEVGHFPQPLVHCLRLQTQASLKYCTGPAASVGKKPKRTYQPLYPAMLSGMEATKMLPPSSKKAQLMTRHEPRLAPNQKVAS
jgi:hypothetical protein